MKIGINISTNLNGVAFFPSSLFGGSDVGDFGDCNSLLYQDVSAATPAAANGQSIARWDGYRGTISWRQVTALNQPTLSVSGALRGALMDGSNDFFSTAAALNMTGSDAFTLVFGVRKTSDAALGMILEASLTTGSNNGSFYLSGPNGVSNGNYGGRSKGTAASDAVTGAASFNPPHSAVLTFQGDISADTSILRVNGTQSATSATDQGTGNLGNHTLYMGMRAGTTFPFAGTIYGWLLIMRILTASEINQAERWMAARSNVTI